MTTVENNRQTAALPARGDWPSFVNLRYGEALGVLAEGGTYDLIFADAPDGNGTDSTRRSPRFARTGCASSTT